MSEINSHTSLARQLANAGMTKTPLAKAIAEAVASWLGTNNTDSKLLNALQSTKEWAAGVLWSTDTNNWITASNNTTFNVIPTAANDPIFEVKKAA